MGSDLRLEVLAKLETGAKEADDNGNSGHVIAGHGLCIIPPCQWLDHHKLNCQQDDAQKGQPDTEQICFTARATDE